VPHITIKRAYRVALSPTVAQQCRLARHEGANRAAYNFHLAAKQQAHQQWKAAVETVWQDQYAHLAPDEGYRVAKKAVNQAKAVRFPTYMDSMKALRADKKYAWHAEVNGYALSSGMQAVDRAWKNWVSSYTGERAGQAVGYPRFRKKGRTRRSFTLFHDVKTPTLRPDGYRRLVLPEKISGRRGGSVRLHGNIRLLARRINNQTAWIRSVTISYTGKYWWASILVDERIDQPAHPTPRQRAGGSVGMDLGVHCLAALSTGEVIANPRHLKTAANRLAKAQRQLARTGWWILNSSGHPTQLSRRRPSQGVAYKPTTGRLKARARVARLHAELADRRATTQHALTKHLVANYNRIAIEDLNVAGMTRSAKGSQEAPGSNVAAKAGLNRSILDLGFGEIRRQLEYKTGWYGSQLVVADRYAPTSKMCSVCRAVKPKLSLAERTYTCNWCGTNIDRDLNAACNILNVATNANNSDACGTQESRNARPATSRASAQPVATTLDGQAITSQVTPAKQLAGHPTQTEAKRYKPDT